MTIDERLEKLTERHEALTQTVELLAADNRQTAAENKKRDERLGQIMEGIARLLLVAEPHEDRINGHVWRIERLDNDKSANETVEDRGLFALNHGETKVVSQFGFGGRAILPAAGFQPALAA